MTTKQLASVGVALAVGFAVASFVHRGGSSKVPLAEARTSLASNGEVDVAALRSDYERQIADLKFQLEAIQRQAGTSAGNTGQTALTSEEFARRHDVQRQASLDTRLQRDTDNLLAAGFTRDRIEWIRKRDDELVAEFRRKEILVEQRKAKPDFSAFVVHSYDSDIELRYELGDEEYARYRQALGRGVGMKVGEVVSGGLGESAGLRAGDEIVSYNGVRVFNVGEVNPLLVKNRESGTTAVVDVIRNGQTIRLSVPPGDMYISPSQREPTTREMLRAWESSRESRLEAARKEDALKAMGGSR